MGARTSMSSCFHLHKEVFARLNLETPEADTVNCSLAKGHSDLWRYNVIFCFNAHGTCWQVKTEWTMQIRKLASFCQGAPARYEEVIPDIPAGSPTSTAESLWTLLQDSSGHIQHSLLNIDIQKVIMGDATAAPVWHWGQITKKAAHPNTYRFLGANLLPDSNTKTVSQVLSLNTRSQTRFIKLYIYMKGTLQLGHCSPLSQGKIWALAARFQNKHTRPKKHWTSQI
jgi:hypothetical protein